MMHNAHMLLLMVLNVVLRFKVMGFLYKVLFFFKFTETRKQKGIIEPNEVYIFFPEY